MDQLLRESVLSSRGFLSEAPPEGHVLMITVTTEKVTWCPCKSLNQMRPWSCCLSPWSLKINPSSNLQYNLLKRFLAHPKISLKVSNKKLSRSWCTKKNIQCYCLPWDLYKMLTNLPKLSRLLTAARVYRVYWCCQLKWPHTRMPFIG